MIETALSNLNIELFDPDTGKWCRVFNIIQTPIGDKEIIPNTTTVEYLSGGIKRIENFTPGEVLFRVSVNKPSSSAYIGFDGKEIKPMSLVRFRMDNIPEKYHEQYSLKDGDMVLFIDEITYQPGHCAIVKPNDGKVLFSFHTDNFEMLTEEEV